MSVTTYKKERAKVAVSREFERENKVAKIKFYILKRQL
jgi:hypothetical protein